MALPIEREVCLERAPRDLFNLEGAREWDAILFPVGNGALLDAQRLSKLLLRAEMSNSDSLFHAAKGTGIPVRCQQGYLFTLRLPSKDHGMA